MTFTCRASKQVETPSPPKNKKCTAQSSICNMHGQRRGKALDVPVKTTTMRREYGYNMGQRMTNTHYSFQVNSFTFFGVPVYFMFSISYFSVHKNRSSGHNLTTQFTSLWRLRNLSQLRLLLLWWGPMISLVDTREPQWSSLRPLCTTVSSPGIIQLGLLRKVGYHIFIRLKMPRTHNSPIYNEWQTVLALPWE